MIILLPNLNQPKLCNGTRLAVKKIMKKWKNETTIIMGKFKGEDVLMVRLIFERDCTKCSIITELFASVTLCNTTRTYLNNSLIWQHGGTVPSSSWVHTVKTILVLAISSKFQTIFEKKTSLGVPCKNCVGTELDWHVTLGSVTLVRVKSARVTAIWIGDLYLRQMKSFMSMTENILNNWYTLQYQE